MYICISVLFPTFLYIPGLSVRDDDGSRERTNGGGVISSKIFSLYFMRLPSCYAIIYEQWKNPLLSANLYVCVRVDERTGETNERVMWKNKKFSRGYTGLKSRQQRKRFSSSVPFLSKASAIHHYRTNWNQAFLLAVLFFYSTSFTFVFTSSAWQSEKDKSDEYMHTVVLWKYLLLNCGAVHPYATFIQIDARNILLEPTFLLKIHSNGMCVMPTSIVVFFTWTYLKLSETNWQVPPRESDCWRNIEYSVHSHFSCKSMKNCGSEKGLNLWNSSSQWRKTLTYCGILVWIWKTFPFVPHTHS